MNIKDVMRNRQRFPREELAKYSGQWVAFSSDCTGIVASAQTLEELHRQLDAQGVDAQQVIFEGIPGPDDDFYLGGEELR